MAVNLKGRSFLTLKDFTPAEIRYLLDLSHDLKAKKRAGILGDSLKGKNVVLLFEKLQLEQDVLLNVELLKKVLM